MDGHRHFAAAVIVIRGALCAAIRDSYFDERPLGIRCGALTRKLAALLIAKGGWRDRSGALRIAIFVLYTMRCAHVELLSCFILGCAATDQVHVEDYNREMLQPLTKFRQQHRRTVDGRLCAAAFVQNRKAYTGCTNSANPLGESGRMWCYVEPQVSVVNVIFVAFQKSVASVVCSSWVGRRHGITAVIALSAQLFQQ